MYDKTVYRWDVRRAAKDRRQKHGGAISTHDLVMLAVIMAMLVIVIRLILIFGVTQGMELGPFRTDVKAMPYEPSPYVNLPSVNESYLQLTSISSALFIYWILASWKSLASRKVSLSTKAFKVIIGVTILVLLASSLLPENALYLADIWFDPPFSPQMQS